MLGSILTFFKASMGRFFRVRSEGRRITNVLKRAKRNIGVRYMRERISTQFARIILKYCFYGNKVVEQNPGRNKN